MSFINFNWMGRKKPVDDSAKESSEEDFSGRTSEEEIAAEMSGTSSEAEETVLKVHEQRDEITLEDKSLAYANSDEHLC